MAAAQKAPVGVDGDLAAEIGFAFLDEGAAFTLFAESQILVFDNLGNGETIVGLGNIDLIGLDSRGFVGLLCGYPEGLPRGPARHVGRHVVQRGLACSLDVDQGLIRQILGLLLASQDDRGASIGNGAAVVQGKRWDDTLGAEGRLQGNGLSELGVGVVQSIASILHRDQGQLLLCRPIQLHVLFGNHGKGRGR